MPNLTTNYNLYKPLVDDPTDEDLWGGYLNDNMDTIDTQMKTNADAIAALTTVPVGCVLPYAGSSAPTDYLLCYGQAVSRTTYADLFTAISTTYGSGDGSTTFNVPDLRGRTVAGQDDMGGTSANRLTNQSGGVEGDTLGAVGGSETHTLTTAQLAAHTHQASNYKAFAGGTGANPIKYLNDDNPAGIPMDTGPNTGSAGGGEAHNNVQPTIILNYIIRH